MPPITADAGTATSFLIDQMDLPDTSALTAQGLSDLMELDPEEEHLMDDRKLFCLIASFGTDTGKVTCEEGAII